jgi:hypothetical protein
MKIYIENINIINNNFNNFNCNILDKLFIKKKYKQNMYSDEGIFYYKNNKLVKIKIDDKPIEYIDIDNYTLAKDSSIKTKIINNYQIPLNYNIDNYLKYSYKINKHIKLIIHSNENIIVNYYFKIKHNDNINNYDDIISFLSLLK